MDKYQQSSCKVRGWLHDYKILEEIRGGLKERCTRCGDIQFFLAGISNYKYLSFHIKQALQPHMPEFKHEYPNSNV